MEDDTQANLHIRIDLVRRELTRTMRTKVIGPTKEDNWNLCSSHVQVPH